LKGEIAAYKGVVFSNTSKSWKEQSKFRCTSLYSYFLKKGSAGSRKNDRGKGQSHGRSNGIDISSSDISIESMGVEIVSFFYKIEARVQLWKVVTILPVIYITRFGLASKQRESRK
jgi:hypothetical protein